MVTYPGNFAKGKRISDSGTGVNKGNGSITEKDIRSVDDIIKGKENMVSAQGIVIQNNFNVLDNIIEQDELNGDNNTTTEVVVSKDVVDINNDIEKEVISNEIHVDNVDMREHKDIKEGHGMVNSADSDSQDKEKHTCKGLDARLEKNCEHQVGVAHTVEMEQQQLDNPSIIINRCETIEGDKHIPISEEQQQLDNPSTIINHMEAGLQSQYQLSVFVNENGIGSFPPERDEVVDNSIIQVRKDQEKIIINQMK
ncbi:hypothetical protein K7X08_000878 [Anisodus acutangulus]|uniref:Uncharacterized protein n=1 Tax=Anisodus acutangulus TaxID=402998 RepID=A0A9Q1MQX2_9SOLA|nr:hypothetical protein K7X08_000878 [Anisodus acutangulus]